MDLLRTEGLDESEMRLTHGDGVVARLKTVKQTLRDNPSAPIKLTIGERGTICGNDCQQAVTQGCFREEGRARDEAAVKQYNLPPNKEIPACTVIGGRIPERVRKKSSL